MPLFITYASYSVEGKKGLIAKPEDRSKVIGALIEKSGGRMLGFYMTAGANDVVVVSEAPDGDNVAALSLAVGASGTLSKIETVRAWTGADFVAVTKQAGGIASAFTPPGR
ncbi:GYD domain-containing protein [Psychromarinibacter sp. S121]|uniref:GYD domain-containing protein n=1 Tax=Psychromarinibacter sp. S121 TaxID=3415127 RepID=UPI003C7CE12B